MRRSWFGTALATLVGGVCSHAQVPVETLTYAVAWDKAEIAPGETNTGTIVPTIAPKLGTVTAWNSKPGNGEPGVLMALASLALDFKNLANGLNGTLSWKVNPAWWAGSGPPPSNDGQGGISGIFFGQFSPPVNPAPILDQVIEVATVKWTAETSPMPTEPYEVVYGAKALWAKVFLDVGLPSGAWAGENAVTTDAQGGFVVIPAPATLAIAGVAWIGLARRRSNA